MKCANCGAEVSEGALFCTSCGSKIEAQAPVEEKKVEQAKEAAPVEAKAETKTEAVVVETPVEAPEAPTAEVTVEKLEVEAPQGQPMNQAPQGQPMNQAPQGQPMGQAPQGQPMGQAPQGQPVGQAPQKAGKKNVLKYVGIGVAVVAVVVILALIIGKIAKSGGSNEKAIVYQKDSTLYYMANMDKEGSEIEIDDTKDYFSSIKLINDGKQLVYIDERNGDLKLVELGKLKKSGNNSKCITEIDSKVDEVYVVSENEIYYVDNKGNLSLYNGKKSEEIDDDVDYILYKSDGVLYYEKYDDKDYEYYLGMYDTKSKKVDECDSDVSIQAIDKDNDKIYMLDGDELFVRDKNGKETTIAEDVYSVKDIDTKTETIYILKSSDTKKVAYDFVNDNFDGEAVSAPYKMDYMTETTPEIALSEDDYESYMYDPEEFLYWMYEDYDTGLKYEYNWDNDTTVYTDGVTWYIFDETRYYDDEYEYENVGYEADRIENLRDELKEYEIEDTQTDLYIIEKGKESLIQENVNNVMVEADKKLAFFGSSDSTDDGFSVDITDIWSAYDVESMLYDYRYNNVSTDNYYAVGTSEKKEFDEAIESLYATNDSDIIVVKFSDEDYESNTEMVAYKISGSDLKETDTLTKKGYYGFWQDGSFFFYDDVDGGEGDLKEYAGGKVKDIAKGVYVSTTSIADDRNVIEIDDSYDLILHTKSGDKVKVGKDVYSYQYINSKRIVYMRDDDLYVYTGKDDSTKIAKNVNSYWTNFEESGSIGYGYDY